jgi:hypothetical protein
VKKDARHAFCKEMPPGVFSAWGGGEIALLVLENIHPPCMTYSPMLPCDKMSGKVYLRNEKGFKELLWQSWC